MTSADHQSATQRLDTALVEEGRLSKRYDDAVGTPSELAAYVRLQVAADQVTARQAWAHWVDDERYRGLNAGPFELLEES
jgi:hypothetical protein